MNVICATPAAAAEMSPKPNYAAVVAAITDTPPHLGVTAFSDPSLEPINSKTLTYAESSRKLRPPLHTRLNLERVALQMIRFMRALDNFWRVRRVDKSTRMWTPGRHFIPVEPTGAHRMPGETFGAWPPMSIHPGDQRPDNENGDANSPGDDRHAQHSRLSHD